MLHFQNGQKGANVLKISLRESDCYHLRVNCTPQDFLVVGPITLPRPYIFQSCQVLGIARQGQEDLLWGVDVAVKYLVLDIRPTLYHKDYVIHIKIIRVRITYKCGGAGPVAGILDFAQYSRTRSAVLERAFAASISVSEKAQKNYRESTQPIDKTRSMKMTTP